MTRWTRLSGARLLWLFLLPLPLLTGYAESGDPLKTMSQISNRAAKGDRLPTAHADRAAWTPCAPVRPSQDVGRCAALAKAD
ncbi:hypothetical protein JOD31_001652 [Methylopila capsulata]|uniref:Uncharacterized protein n=1 Tax=Methylopila capsulata TaxID=61654 RepID=A0ABS2T5G7_9HYPH|nr:hypothetical protein [Methylopila capsulata]